MLSFMIEGTHTEGRNTKILEGCGSTLGTIQKSCSQLPCFYGQETWTKQPPYLLAIG